MLTIRKLNRRRLSHPSTAGARGAMAGNGEYMAAKQQQLKGRESGSKTTGARKTSPQQLDQPARRQDTPRTRRTKNANQKDLAAVLSQKALAGDVESARLLVTMADRKKATPPPKKKRRGLTYAQQLALDPPWQGELPAPFVSIYDTKPKTD